MRLKVGLIGVGDNWEQQHKPALRALAERFEVCAVCCAVSKKAERVASEFGAIAVDGFRAMMERNSIDAVLALSLDWIGPLPLLAACEAGKAVYSSAALDIAPDQASEIKRRVEASGVAFMAELPRRHAPATLRLKELIATRLGKPRLLFCHDRQPCEEVRESGRYIGKYCPAGTRNFMELVDWCRYVVDSEPTSVLGVEHRHTYIGHDANYKMISLQFPGAAESETITAQISVGNYMPPRWEHAMNFRRPPSLQVVCENGVAFLDLPTTLNWFDESGQHTESLETDRPVGEQMLTHFHRAVTSLVRNTSDLEDAYRALRVVTTAQESVSSGERLKIEF